MVGLSEEQRGWGGRFPLPLTQTPWCFPIIQWFSPRLGPRGPGLGCGFEGRNTSEAVAADERGPSSGKPWCQLEPVLWARGQTTGRRPHTRKWCVALDSARGYSLILIHFSRLGAAEGATALLQPQIVHSWAGACVCTRAEVTESTRKRWKNNKQTHDGASIILQEKIIINK